MSLYPGIEPFETGMLAVGDGDRIYYEVCGNPNGKPAVFLHGGPGSGCSPGNRRMFDPERYRVVLFDQRNCGRSTPHAGQPVIDLSRNTTWTLVDDIERLRVHLGIDRWLVWGGSWGSVLALAYATRHPERVTEMVMVGVASGRHAELDWLFRGGLSKFFPVEWERLTSFARQHCEASPKADPLPDKAGSEGSAVIEAYWHMLNDPDPAVHNAGAYEWCLYESASPHWPPRPGLLPRFQDPVYALCFARVVIHYVRHNQWLPEDGLLPQMERIGGIPAVLVNGRYDFQSPPENAFLLKRSWPSAELVVLDDAGHMSGEGLTEALVGALDGFARGGH